jgi:CheY-like chemotaxis protein
VAASGDVRVAFTDQTELRVAERAAEQAKRMESISRLAGGIAHDLNNLLTVVSVHDDFLLRSVETGDPRRTDLEAIHDALQQAAALTTRLMAFARPQVFAVQRVGVNTLLRDFVPLLRRLLPSRVTITTTLQPDVGQVMADPALLEQLVTHLAVNAADAMPQGGTLHIASERVAMDASALAGHPGVTPGRFVCISVTDTGVGMDAATLAHVFEPYFTTKPQGIGLGLATVYAVIRQAGGFVRASSAVGKGTHMQMFLPESALASAPAGHETILVVEDEPSIRLIVSRMLTRLGYTVHQAANGEDAMGLLLTLGFAVDLVITDVVMPRMGGPEFVRTLREHRPSMRVVFMTGYASAEEMSEQNVPSHFGVLLKPFSLEALEQLVRSALDAT